MKKNMNKGFSLVELIIVIAIMAVLVGVLAPQFIKYVESSRQSTDIDTVAEFKSAAESYVADAMAMGLNVNDVVVNWQGGTVKLTGGAPAGSAYTVNDAMDDLGITGSKLKSTGWGGGTATYNTTNFKWGNITSDQNSKKPKKNMNAAFE